MSESITVNENFERSNNNKLNKAIKDAKKAKLSKNPELIAEANLILSNISEVKEKLDYVKELNNQIDHLEKEFNSMRELKF